jgi:hypothetical protein
MESKKGAFTEEMMRAEVLLMATKIAMFNKIGELEAITEIARLVDQIKSNIESSMKESSEFKDISFGELSKSMETTQRSAPNRFLDELVGIHSKHRSRETSISKANAKKRAYTEEDKEDNKIKVPHDTIYAITFEEVKGICGGTPVEAAIKLIPGHVKTVKSNTVSIGTLDRLCPSQVLSATNFVNCNKMYAALSSRLNKDRAYFRNVNDTEENAVVFLQKLTKEIVAPNSDSFWRDNMNGRPDAFIFDKNHNITGVVELQCANKIGENDKINPGDPKSKQAKAYCFMMKLNRAVVFRYLENFAVYRIKEFKSVDCFEGEIKPLIAAAHRNLNSFLMASKMKLDALNKKRFEESIKNATSYWEAQEGIDDYLETD